jgi:hypothetical protein
MQKLMNGLRETIGDLLFLAASKQIHSLSEGSSNIDTILPKKSVS